MRYSYKKIREVFDRKGHKFFDQGFYNLNIIGIRSEESQSDKFDDELHVLYHERPFRNVYRHDVYQITTDPGKHYLLNPMNPGGCLIMAPGQYIGSHTFGMHRGQYRALVQAKPMDFVRDNNRDTKLDFSLYRDPIKRRASLITGMFGANIHRASKISDVLHVAYYSAGCQVFRKSKEYNEYITLCDRQVMSGHGKFFTYTLLEEIDFQ